MVYQESENVELKSKVVDDIKKEVIAFANTNGGKLYVGIDDDGTIIGLDDIDACALQISNMIRDCIKPDVTMFLHCEAKKENDKKYLEISVQRGTDRPYYIAKKRMRPEGVYVRQGFSSVCASDNAIKAMIKETDGDCFEDMRSLNQDLTFNSAIKEFELRDVEFKKQTLRLMDNDGLYSNLAFLLSDQCSYGIKAATFQGKDQSIFKDPKEFNGSIFKQMSELYEYIDLRNKTYTKIEGLYRVDKRDYPEVTIRESLMNILVHHDYSFSASCLVNIYDDRIEFISIGGLVSGIELEDCLAGVSICRNQNLANVFYQLNLIENYGTGLSKIMNSYQDCNIKPSIQTTKNSFKIILPNINETNDILVVNDYSFKYEIDDEKDVILNYLNTHDFITRKDVENLLFTSGPIAYRTLKKLVDEGLLTQKGKARNIKYFKAKK